MVMCLLRVSQSKVHANANNSTNNDAIVVKLCWLMYYYVSNILSKFGRKIIITARTRLNKLEAWSARGRSKDKVTFRASYDPQERVDGAIDALYAGGNVLQKKSTIG
jgi:hypothetical protein